MTHRRMTASILTSLSLVVVVSAATHPPMRPLPVASKRPITSGASRFVHPKGDDGAEGTREKPWKTIRHAVGKLVPGETLYIRGGIYHEHVRVIGCGTDTKPITIRSYPGEIAILDGGLSEFLDSPTTAWEPVPGGKEGEFRSVKAYPDLAGGPGQTNLLGSFADSMVPLHGYRFLADLRSDNVYWNILNKTGDDVVGIYCGPGVFLDSATKRIHIRLAPTRMKYLAKEDNYSGEADPRKIPLIIAGHGGSPLSLQGAKHVRVQDLVVRGSRGPTIEVSDSANLDFDGLAVYGGSTCFQVKDSAGVRLIHTACRGLAAPWTFRGSLKYRAIESRLFSSGGWTPSGVGNREFEFAWSEFTDSVDGVFIGNVRGVRMHHCFLDNVSDDGVFLTAGTAYDGTTPGGDIHLYQNLFSRCLTTFAFGVGHGRQKTVATGLQTGAGVHVYRNVFDQRRAVHYHQPVTPDEPQEVRSKGRFAGDHGGPAWEPMRVYHNTILADDAPRYSYGTWGLGDHINRGTSRRVFNNVVAQVEHLPGTTFPVATTDLQVDGNLHWSMKQGASVKGDLFSRFRGSKAFADSKARYAPGWGASDRFADPKFVQVAADWKTAVDLRPSEGSPCFDAGVAIPSDWSDPLRSLDKGKPDIGAFPAGVESWHVGVRGRLTASGEEKSAKTLAAPKAKVVPERNPPTRKPAAIVEGYPARDVPLVEFALRRQGVRVDVAKHAWLDPKEYRRYGLVVVAGNLVRAKIEPNHYAKSDLEHVREYLRDGGLLLMMISGKDVFRSPEGRSFLADLTGKGETTKEIRIGLREPTHPWVKHLDAKSPPAWVAGTGRVREHQLRVSKGERILASTEGAATLYRVAVGKGALIYVGWEISEALPQTRAKPATLDQEKAFDEQMRILFGIVESIYPTTGSK